MSASKTLDGPPGTLPLYLRAALPMIPLASRLPWVGGRGTEVPDTVLRLQEVAVEADAVAAYDKVCGFRLRDEIPATYLHVLAFPLHMALMTDGSFPFAAIGLVHIENTITQHRPVRIGERVDLSVRATSVEPHPKGKTFSLVSEAHVGGELVWEDVSTMLRRGKGDESAAKPSRDAEPEIEAAAEWRLPGDLGRRYAKVSGDTNPIHMTDLTAKAFGFPRAIAHGMWTKARALAALEHDLPAAYTVSVRFKKPILLPSTVTFGSRTDGDTTRFAVRGKRKPLPHLDGTMTRRTTS